MSNNKPLAIHFEGIDGVGKTTSIERLSKYLKSKGLRVETVKFPTDNSIIEDGRVKGFSNSLTFLRDMVGWLSSHEFDNDVYLIDRSFLSTAVYQSEDDFQIVALISYGLALFKTKLNNYFTLVMPSKSGDDEDDWPKLLAKECEKRGRWDKKWVDTENLEVLSSSYLRSVLMLEQMTRSEGVKKIALVGRPFSDDWGDVLHRQVVQITDEILQENNLEVATTSILTTD